MSTLKSRQESVLPSLNSFDILRDKVDAIDVRRAHLWADNVQAMTRQTFTGEKWLRVHFVFEEAVDDGGPRREFFRLALQECCNSELFDGPLHSRVVSLSVPALQQKKYLVAGEPRTLKLLRQIDKKKIL